MRKLILAAGAIGGLALTQANAATVLNDVARGAYNDSGVFGTGGSGTPSGNYVTGMYTGAGQNEYRSFFGFDLSGVTGSITGASITITTAGFGGGAASADVGFFDYSGSYSALIGNSGGVAAFNDLGNGNLYGSQIVSTSTSGFTIVLDAAALTDLNAAEGGTFVAGGALIGAPVGTFVFGGSSFDPPTQLTLQIVSVSEPGTFALLGSALLTLGALVTRGKQGGKLRRDLSAIG